MNPLVSSIPVLKEAFEKLPQPYATIDEDFLSNHKDIIEKMKEQFLDKGGIHLLDVGEERKIICRVPNKSQVDEALEKARKENKPTSPKDLLGNVVFIQVSRS